MRLPHALLLYIPLFTACYTGVSIPTGGGETSETGGSEGEQQPPQVERAFPNVPGTPDIAYISTLSGPVALPHMRLDNGFGVIGDIVLYGPDLSLVEPNRPGPTDKSIWFESEPASIAETEKGILFLNDQKGAVSTSVGVRWTNRTIPWRLAIADKTVDDTLFQAPASNGVVAQGVRDAIAEIESKVNVNFVELTSPNAPLPDDYLEIYESSDTCMSYIGRIGGPQPLVLTDGCASSIGSTMHELGHAMGLFHEQNRPDRDDNIVVNEEFLVEKDGLPVQYEIFPDVYFGQDILFYPSGWEYNTASIMHYDSCWFSRCLSKGSSARCKDSKGNECSYDRAGESECDHCQCWNASKTSCAAPVLETLSGGVIEARRDALAPGDVMAMNYALGCPAGDNGNYCGGPIGLDDHFLYSCAGGYYSFLKDCDPGTCIPAPQGSNDDCSSVAQCPSGNGDYCGQAVGLEEDVLYTCTNQTAPMPPLYVEKKDCGAIGEECVMEGPLSHDHCSDELPQTDPEPDPECQEGPCCVDGQLLEAGIICAENLDSQVGCPWGTMGGADVGVQYRDGVCDGVLPGCDTLGEWKGWEVLDDCAVGEYCDPGDPTCSNVPPIPDCVNGACCDPNGFFRPNGYVCLVDAGAEYNCPWGTSPGDDVGVRRRDQTCSGVSANCDGAFAAWKAWEVQDFCSQAEVCQPGDSTCNACAPSYWIPTNTSDVAWDSQSVAQLKIEKQEVSGDVVRARVCKIGGLFNNDIHFDYEEWGKHFGWFMHSGTVSTLDLSCSQWINLDTSTWNEGEIIGAQVRVVSPSWCAGMWDDQCNIDPGCGNCWYWLSDTVMERTCL